MPWELLLTGAVSAAVAISLLLVVYTRMKAGAKMLADRLREMESSLTEIAPLQIRLSKLEAQHAQALEQRKHHADWISEAESLNLNHRGQVIRLHRRGDSVADIASALRMGQAEVLLMTKIYDLAQEFPKREDEQKQIPVLDH